MEQGKDGSSSDPPPSYLQSTPTANMPTSYESGPPTFTQPAVGTPGTVDQAYILSPGSALTIVQGVLSFLAFICAASDAFFVQFWGGGWVIFVGVVTSVIQVGIFLVHLLQYTAKLPSSADLVLMEFIYCGVVTSLFFTCGIVAAVRWWLSTAVRACTMFCWFAFVAYGVDCALKFQNWRVRNSSGLPATFTVTHTTPNITTDSQY